MSEPTSNAGSEPINPYATPGSTPPPPPPPAGHEWPTTPPPATPVGGYAPAPSYDPQGGYGAPVGSKPYVEQHFGPVAGFGARAGALIIDALLGLIGIIPFMAGVVIMAIAAADVPTQDSHLAPQDTGNAAGILVGFLVMGLGIALILAIFIWNRIFKMGRTGQSVGKKVVGLKLINQVSGEPIGAGSAFLREIVHGVVNQIVYLSYLWMLWDDNKQTLGDLAVKSTVITVPKS